MLKCRSNRRRRTDEGYYILPDMKYNLKSDLNNRYPRLSSEKQKGASLNYSLLLKVLNLYRKKQVSMIANKISVIHLYSLAKILYQLLSPYVIFFLTYL